MAAQPRDEDVDQMCSLMGIDRQEALRRLKGNNNNLNQAINEMFENPDSSRYTWDEGQFNSDRDGSMNHTGTSFQIQSADETEPRYYPIAPSRPPSRTDTKSPLGDRVMSLATEHAAADTRNRLAREEMDDPALRKALAESAEEAGLSPQQYGTTEGVNTVHFGPANRNIYEGEWQMVPIGSSSAHQLPPDPEAIDRKREEGTPAFLKPSTPENRLASMLTIFHEIPLARETFLDRADLLPDFGYDREWWNGKAIGPGITLAGRPWADDYGMDDEEVIREVQRLMAFLDKTDRSYGSALALADLRVVKAASASEIESKFLEAWKDAHQNTLAAKSIFSVAMQPKHVLEDEEIGGDPIEFAILDLALPNAEDSGEIETLYDVADQVLWSLSGLQVETSAYLTRIGDVITFRILGHNSSKRIKIPAVWYADRYIESGREAALGMRKQKRVIKDRMAKIFAMENKLTYFTLAGGKVVKVKDMIDVSLRHDEEAIPEEVVNGIGSRQDDSEIAAQPLDTGKLGISAELQNLVTNIDRKLRVLQEEKEKALVSLRDLSKLLTEQSSDSNSPSHKYTLRGVSTSKGTTYVRRRAEPDLIDMDLDETEPRTRSDQWWKIDYDATSVKPVSVEKVTEESVLLAAMAESKSILLVVYANEKAVSEPFQPLPDVLEAFVRTDNLAFSAEFPFSQESQSQTSVTTPKSPGKRKYADSSDDSPEASMRAHDLSSPTRWGGMSPARDTYIPISQRELHNSDPREAAKLYFPPPPRQEVGTELDPGRSTEDIIMGQDPTELVDTSIPVRKEVMREPAEAQELKVKNGLASFMPNLMGDEKKRQVKSNDVMDVDESAGTVERVASKPDHVSIEGAGEM